jgi:isoleucyl-tRNA synthetase
LYDLISNNLDKLTAFDKWVLAKIDELIRQVSDSMERFYF